MAYGYSVKARDTRGLDPTLYRVNIGVHRLDGEPLTDEEMATIRAALAPEALSLPPAPSAATSGQEPPAAADGSTGTGGE